MAELIRLARRELNRPLLGRRALGRDHDRERPPAGVAATQQAADFLDVEGAFRDQDDVSAAGEA